MNKAMMYTVLFLLLGSLLVIAETEEESSCSSFWGSISCFLWGNPQNRAGQAWFERGNE